MLSEVGLPSFRTVFNCVHKFNQRWLTSVNGTTRHFLPREAAMTERSWYRNSVRLFVRLSVCLSVTRVLCAETKEHTSDVLIPVSYTHLTLPTNREV